MNILEPLVGANFAKGYELLRTYTTTQSLLQRAQSGTPADIVGAIGKAITTLHESGADINDLLEDVGEDAADVMPELVAPTGTPNFSSPAYLTAFESARKAVQDMQFYCLVRLNLRAHLGEVPESNIPSDVVEHLSDLATALGFTPAVLPPVVTKPADVSVNVGGPVNVTLKTSAGTPPITFTTSTLPAGLTRSGATISGTVTTAGVTTVTVTATNSAGSSDTTFKITVTEVDPPEDP